MYHSTLINKAIIHSIILVFLFSKDVRLPVQLQRAMAAEAEAAREARAKVKHPLKFKLAGFIFDKTVFFMSAK